MPITLGILAQARQAPVAPGDFVLLDTRLLTTTEASVSFTSLNATYGSTYKHLQIRMTGRTNASGEVGDQFKLTLNSTEVATHSLVGTGSTIFGLYYSTDKVMGWITGAGAPSDVFGANVVDILDPFVTTKNTTVRTLGGEATTIPRVGLQSGALFDTTAISTITLTGKNGSFVSGSRFSLYGIRG
jgi:hypothetical protein